MVAQQKTVRSCEETFENSSYKNVKNPLLKKIQKAEARSELHPRNHVAGGRNFPTTHLRDAKDITLSAFEIDPNTRDEVS